MNTHRKLLLLFLALAVLGTVSSVFAGETYDTTPPSVDWRFCGPRIRPGACADWSWDCLFLLIQHTTLPRFWTTFAM